MMNKRIDFTNLGGLAVYQDTLDFLQSSYEGTLGALARALGGRVIITGVTDLGNDYSDGWVAIDGEILPFAGGLKAPNVMIEEVADTEVFGDDSVRSVYYTRRARPTSIGGFPLSSFTRINEVGALTTKLTALTNTVSTLAVVPKGLISMWSGAIGNIPAGWALCDGTNGTPNLKGKFIVGYDSGDSDYNVIGKPGGEKRHTLLGSEMPMHRHDYVDRYYVEKGAASNSEQMPSLHNNRAGSHSTDYDNDYFYTYDSVTGYTGGSAAHENRPPFYTMAYIIKL